MVDSSLKTGTITERHGGISSLDLWRIIIGSRFRNNVGRQVRTFRSSQTARSKTFELRGSIQIVPRRSISNPATFQTSRRELRKKIAGHGAHVRRVLRIY